MNEVQTNVRASILLGFDGFEVVDGRKSIACRVYTESTSKRDRANREFDIFKNSGDCLDVVKILGEIYNVHISFGWLSKRWVNSLTPYDLRNYGTYEQSVAAAINDLPEVAVCKKAEE